MGDTKDGLCQKVREYSVRCYSTNPKIWVTNCYHGDCNSAGWCDCRPGWDGFLCNQCCDLDCQNEGVCDAHVNGTSCICPTGFKGDLCEKNIIPPQIGTSWQVWCIVGLISAVVLIVLVSIMAALYYAWKTGRLPLVIQRIIYRCRKFEDDAGLTVDVAVSASGDEIPFVRKKLLPKLEAEMNMTVWLAPHDEVNAEMETIKKSRRILLLISRKYVQEEWLHLTQQVALCKWLKQNKQRIIPIILENISNLEGVDNNLLYILRSIPCLKWPGEGMEKKEKVFWEKLRLFIAKQRETPV